MSNPLFSGAPQGQNKDAIMHTLEKLFPTSKYITNLNNDELAAIMELEYIDEYFKKQYSIDVKYTSLTKNFREHRPSITDKFHRATQAVDVMKAQALDMPSNKEKSIIEKLMGA